MTNTEMLAASLYLTKQANDMGRRSFLSTAGHAIGGGLIGGIGKLIHADQFGEPGFDNVFGGEFRGVTNEGQRKAYFDRYMRTLHAPDRVLADKLLPGVENYKLRSNGLEFINKHKDEIAHDVSKKLLSPASIQEMNTQYLRANAAKGVLGGGFIGGLVGAVKPLLSEAWDAAGRVAKHKL